MIKLEKLRKTFEKSGKKIEVLKDINFTFKTGFHVVMGASGSGKTTLLKIIGGIQEPTSGNVIINSNKLGSLSDKELTRLRNRNIGFIYQTFELFDYLTALENVLTPMIPINTNRERGEELLRKVGMGDRKNHTPRELSGGEKQRVGIARALANDPDVVLADEPTGNLDKETSKEVINVLKEAVGGRTLILATHDRNIIEGADQKIKLENGEFEVTSFDVLPIGLKAKGFQP